MSQAIRPSTRRAFLRTAFALGLVGVAGAPVFAGPLRAPAGAVPVVDLVETPRAFSPQRLSLRAGRYVFRVHNQGVEHPVGLLLSRLDDDGAVGPRVQGATLAAPVPDGAAATTAVVELAPGRYTYRCVLNPTPHYFITVE